MLIRQWACYDTRAGSGRHVELEIREIEMPTPNVLQMQSTGPDPCHDFPEYSIPPRNRLAHGTSAGHHCPPDPSIAIRSFAIPALNIIDSMEKNGGVLIEPRPIETTDRFG